MLSGTLGGILGAPGWLWRAYGRLLEVVHNFITHSCMILLHYWWRISNDNHLILRRRRTRFSKESRKIDIVYYRSFCAAYGWLSAKTCKAFLTKNLGWKIWGGNSSLRMWYSISCILKVPNNSDKGPKMGPKCAKKTAEKWPDGDKMEPKIGQEAPWSPKIATRGFTKDKECDEEAARWAQEAPKRAEKGTKWNRCISF